MPPGRANQSSPSVSRWGRIYLSVAIYTLMLIVLLYAFSRYFSG